jgi:nitroreductase
MDIHEALYTTRAMRRVKTDPIPETVQARILDAAIRAPTGGNAQTWRFLLLDAPGKKAQLGPLYRDAIHQLYTTRYASRIAAVEADPDSPQSQQMSKVFKSSAWLAEHFEEVPLFLFAFAQRDPSGGSIFPAVWNAQLAARAEGVGSALTSILGLYHDAEVKEVLGVPAEEGWVQACCVSFGYPLGRWDVAPRRPVHEVSYRNGWGEPVGFEVPGPLWSKDGAGDGDEAGAGQD